MAVSCPCLLEMKEVQGIQEQGTVATRGVVMEMREALLPK